MEDYKLGPMETRFAELIWCHAPVSSGELVKICQKELEWKKSTTYTMLRRLCQRGIFQNQDGMVSALLSREEFHALQSEKFIADTFQGSLPAFLAAFTRRKKLTDPSETGGMTYVADIIFKDFKHESNFGLDYSFDPDCKDSFSKSAEKVYLFVLERCLIPPFMPFFFGKYLEYDSQC